MDIRLLQSFLILGEELSFLRAAARIGISQPALSQQIARLEATLHVVLVDRAHRQVALTAAGTALVAEAEEICQRWSTLRAVVKRAAAGQIGALTVGFVDAAALSVLPRLMAEFSQRYPEVCVTLRSIVSHRQADELRAGRIDVALARPVFPVEEFDGLLLTTERYVLALAENDPLGKAESIAIEDLRDRPLIATTRAKSRYIDSRFRNIFAAHGIVPRIMHEVDELHAILALVAQGFGASILPESIRQIGYDGVVYRPIDPAQSPTAELMLAWNADTPTPTLQNFIAVASRQRGPACAQPSGRG